MLINNNCIFNQNSSANSNINMFAVNNFNNNFMSNANNIFPNTNKINNNEITLLFKFSTGLEGSIKCNINEKFSEVINRFKQIKNINDEINAVVSEGHKVNIDKTLLEQKLRNGQIIVFIVGQKIDIKIEKIKKIYKLSKDEIVQIKKWFIEYEINQMLNIDNNGKQDNSEDKKFEYIKKQEKRCFIIIKEHHHKLVYCISLLNWECSLCKNKYNKEDAKYYCSLCDFNMCDNCHSKHNCTKKKAFPEGVVQPSNEKIKEQFLETKYHKMHKLFYCRTSRSVIGYSTWICNICDKKFNNDIWSFYCTQCDFDLCKKCAGFN